MGVGTFDIFDRYMLLDRSQRLRPPPPAPFGFAGSPFGGLGASCLTFWEPFWHLGSTLGGHFGTSGAPWEAILTPQDHTGAPWEQQDGHEVANNRILVDLGMISGPVCVGFFKSQIL